MIVAPGQRSQGVPPLKQGPVRLLDVISGHCEKILVKLDKKSIKKIFTTLDGNRFIIDRLIFKDKGTTIAKFVVFFVMLNYDYDLFMTEPIILKKQSLILQPLFVKQHL